ncbi:hypothetical protein ABK040_001871 [Willaertia magna]
MRARRRKTILDRDEEISDYLTTVYDDSYSEKIDWYCPLPSMKHSKFIEQANEANQRRSSTVVEAMKGSRNNIVCIAMTSVIIFFILINIFIFWIEPILINKYAKPPFDLFNITTSE